MYYVVRNTRFTHFLELINQLSVPRTANPPLKIVFGIKSQSVIFGLVGPDPRTLFIMSGIDPRMQKRLIVFT